MQTNLEFSSFDINKFYDCPNISIDNAIMEHTSEAVMVPLETNWSDLGSWNALKEIYIKDKYKNVFNGRIVSLETKNSLIHSTSDRLIATNDIENLTIIDTKDALLVSSHKGSKNNKQLVEKIRKFDHTKVEAFLDENRPWGSFESITKSDRYQVKKIIVNPGGQLSLQKHKYRSEHWVVVSGVATVIKDKKTITLKQNESIYIPKGTIHSISNKTKQDLVIIEVQTGSYLGEDDIERIEDIYSRE